MKLLKLIPVALLLLAGAVQAAEPTLDEAVVAARCGILLAATDDANKVDLAVYSNIMKAYALHPRVVYQAGYTIGILDAHGFINGVDVGYAQARATAAAKFYKELECKANVLI